MALDMIIEQCYEDYFLGRLKLYIFSLQYIN